MRPHFARAGLSDAAANPVRNFVEHGLAHRRRAAVGTAAYPSRRVKITTHKRGVPVDIEVTPDLAAALAAAPTPHLTFLATQGGRTRSAKAAYTWFSEAARTAGLPAKYTSHGCRKGVLTEAAEHGATEHELAALAGHSSTKSVSAYTRKARSGVLADGATAKLDRGEKGTITGPPSKKVGQNIA